MTCLNIRIPVLALILAWPLMAKAGLPDGCLEVHNGPDPRDGVRSFTLQEQWRAMSQLHILRSSSHRHILAT